MSMLRPNVILRKKRVGNGFSRKELEEAKLTQRQAKLLGVAFDARRGTAYKENVNVLEYLKSEAKKSMGG
jgi:ribosomal protein L13E